MASLGDPFPKTTETDPQDERAIARLMRFLETRIQRRGLLREDAHEKQNHFRNILVEVEHENTSLRYCNDEQKKIISTLEGRVSKLQNHIDGLLYKLNNACDVMRCTQQELRDKDRQLKQHTLEKQRIIQKYNAKMQVEIDRMTQELEKKLREQHERLMSHIKEKDDKLKLVRQILTSAREDTSDDVVLTPPIASSSRIETVKEAIPTISKKISSTVMPINLQASRRSCWQVHQTLSSSARSNPDTNIQGKVAERSSLLISKEKPSTVISIDSQASKNPRGQIRQTLSSRARSNPDDVRGETAMEPILMIDKEEPSMASDSKTEIAEESTTLVDSPLSSTIASTDTVSVAKTKSNTKIPVVNPRYRRSQNADRWIDHRPAGIVPTGTILQPQTQPHKRTIRKLTRPKDFAAKSSRYCLLSQEQDADGELETKLYKADVLPTCGGGAQIVFNDIECLKQISPTAAKRNGQIKLEHRPIDKSHVDCQKVYVNPGT